MAGEVLEEVTAERVAQQPSAKRLLSQVGRWWAEPTVEWSHHFHHLSLTNNLASESFLFNAVLCFTTTIESARDRIYAILKLRRQHGSIA